MKREVGKMGRLGGGKRDRETEREGKGRRLGERLRQESVTLEQSVTRLG